MVHFYDICLNKFENNGFKKILVGRIPEFLNCKSLESLFTKQKHISTSYNNK